MGLKTNFPWLTRDVTVKEKRTNKTIECDRDIILVSLLLAVTTMVTHGDNDVGKYLSFAALINTFGAIFASAREHPLIKTYYQAVGWENSYKYQQAIEKKRERIEMTQLSGWISGEKK
ncbi:MAG: hypothetical protein M1484_02585 [Patescibacteria group bacterium]|nr:hypothetical protein [Patescibacteria group bacterium]MCL5431968.1 hypothetical protein [Patescibacteria group bacterium]